MRRLPAARGRPLSFRNPLRWRCLHRKRVAPISSRGASSRPPLQPPPFWPEPISRLFKGLWRLCRADVALAASRRPPPPDFGARLRPRAQSFAHVRFQRLGCSFARLCGQPGQSRLGSGPRRGHREEPEGRHGDPGGTRALTASLGRRPRALRPGRRSRRRRVKSCFGVPARQISSPTAPSDPGPASATSSKRRPMDELHDEHASTRSWAALHSTN